MYWKEVDDRHEQYQDASSSEPTARIGDLGTELGGKFDNVGYAIR